MIYYSYKIIIQIKKRNIRKNGHDYYKVKWSGWPEEAWTWCHIGDIDALNKIQDFRDAMASNLPIECMPRFRKKNYRIPDEFREKILSKYKKEKGEVF